MVGELFPLGRARLSIMCEIKYEEFGFDLVVGILSR